MPLMVNIRSYGVNEVLGDAAAVYLPDDFYIPAKWAKRYPTAIAFIYVKTVRNQIFPIYTVDEAVERVWRGDKENVRAYLTDPVRRRELEPEYVGPFVSETLSVRLPRR